MEERNRWSKGRGGDLDSAGHRIGRRALALGSGPRTPRVNPKAFAPGYQEALDRMSKNALPPTIEEGDTRGTNEVESSND
jgi:hypothetical protein